MTEKGPGWYVDPSGLPDTFRWWDGRQWTQALTSDQTSPAPAPADAAPVVPPGQSSEAAVDRPADAVQPPASAAPLSEAHQGGSAPPPEPQQSGGQPYGGQPYGGQPYGGQPYGGQPYGGQPYGGQPPAGQHPGRHPAGEHLGWQQAGRPQPATSGADQSVRLPSGSVPPPPGAPGPGYLPWSHSAPPSGPTEVLSTGGEPPAPDGSRRLVVVLIAVAVVAVLAAGGAYLAFFRDSDSNVASPTTSPTPTQEDQPAPSTSPTPSLAPSSSPSAAPSTSASPSSPPARTSSPSPDRPAPAGGPRLRFTPLPSPWIEDDGAAGLLANGYAQARVTEEGYNGKDNWVALAATGDVDPRWFDPKDLARSADGAAEWFAGEGFVGAKVTRDTEASRSLTIDGRPAHLLRQHFAYRIPDLTSRGETVYLVVVDLGNGSSGAVFVASVPDTNPALKQDIEKAIQSLKVVN
ncbi:DUF2510 domain-containing protein [Actinopolymorpha alba]|uniref:DUF2510 domain-containing protein n=1 Tax=Actinopolymorpha alba TaxID=533267 RepID=UPI0003AA11DF|nr:DUF2510 domain-containing protein [Actinopolymorpha alba]